VNIHTMSLCGEVAEAKRLQADHSSIADLIAETHRKKGEALKNKLQGNYRPEKQKEKKNNIWSKENTGLMARMQKDIEKRKQDERDNERVRLQLERKSRLYDSLQKGKGKSRHAENFLVQFGGVDDSDSDEDQGKDYPPKSAGEEWVEYTDALGRTRTCMKKDLPSLKEQDKHLKRDEDLDREGATGEGLRAEVLPDMLSEEMRLQMLREKWEQQEIENLEKENLHYSDVRFDEARTHGAGFYNFSKDDVKRASEQATLKKFHEETDDMRRQKERKSANDAYKMKQRLKKVRAAKRAKQGLPPVESDSDSDDDVKGEEQADDGPDDFNRSVLDGLKMFRKKNDEEEERRKNEAMRVASGEKRDWDKDKEDLQSLAGKEWRVMDQREWNAKKREERKSEFAPPSAYQEAKWFLKEKEKEAAISRKRKPADTENNFYIDKNPQHFNGQFSKPPSMENNQFSKPPPSMEFKVPPPPLGSAPTTMKATIPEGNMNPMTFLDANPEPQPSPSNNFNNSNERPGSQYAKIMKMEVERRGLLENSGGGMSRSMLDEIKAFQEASDEDDSDDDENRGKRAEVAPPCSMDYFNNTVTNPKNSFKQGFRSHEDMADAFNAGLQAQKK